MAQTGLDVSVVLPTYKESGSLPVLVPRIAAALQAAQLAGEVIVVDDDSPDGTAEVAERLSASYPVRVLKRTTERGLATAVLAGFAMSRATVCVVMDADGSHPVEALADMVRLILDDKAEVVVGSRHVPGGGSKDWPLFSQLKSRFAASLAFGLTTMTDPTTGFMAVRRSRLEGLTLDPVGWKIVLETVVKAHPVRLAEVPIVFTDREHGESKQSLRVLGQYLSHLWKLYDFRFPGVVEFLKFCLVGFLGVFVDLSVVATLKQSLALDTRLCQVFGFGAAVTFNFAINRRYSFRAAARTPLVYSYAAYLAANLLGLTVRMVAIQALMRLTELDRGQGYLFLSAIGIALATLVNFVGVKYFAFAPERLATPQPDDRDADPAPAALEPARGATLALALLSAGVLAGALVAPHGLAHDEQVNLTMAANIRAGVEGLVHPSVTPGPVADWREQALPALGNTPVYPLVLAGAGAAGPVGLGLLGALTWLAALAAIGLSLARVDRGAGRAALLVASGSPALLSSFALFEFEPAVAATGALGFWALTRTGAAHSAAFGALAGAFVGLGFALKMWLVVPALFACVGYLVSRANRSTGAVRQAYVRSFAPFALAFAACALSHLAFVAVTAPGDLTAWVEWVYLGLFSGRGVTGPKLSGAGAVHGDAHSALAYLGWLLRDHGALLVPLTLGIPAATRRVATEPRGVFAAALGAGLALVPLSVPAVKEPLYMLPALPYFYVFAGAALAAPDRVPPRHVRVNRGAARASLVVAGLLTVGLVLGWLIQGAALAALVSLVVRVGHVLVWSAPSVRVLRGHAVTPTLVPAALASLALGAVSLFMR